MEEQVKPRYASVPGMMRTGRDLMALPWYKAVAYRLVFAFADLFGLWRRPLDLEYEKISLRTLLVWFYIAGRPVLRGPHGAGLETWFASQLRSPPPFPPSLREGHRLTLAAAGDLMCNPALDDSDEGFYEEVDEFLFGSDLAFGNLESTLTREAIAPPIQGEGENPKINASLSQYRRIIGREGRTFDVVQLANNHILDCGLEGVETTIAGLERDGIAQVGLNLRPGDEERGLVLERKGFRVGFVAATYGLNGRPLPEGKPALVDVVAFHREREAVELGRITRKIARCREEGADFVVLGLHWGLEWMVYPMPYQMRQARLLAEAGADLIAGHHPHVIQPLEWYRTERDPDRYVPILYSLGNLVPIVSAPFSALALAVRVELARAGKEGRGGCYIAGFETLPVIQLSRDRNSGSRPAIVPLATAIEAPASPDDEAYLREAATWADRAIGSQWRGRHA